MIVRVMQALCALSLACRVEVEPPAETCPDGEVADGERCVPEACGTGTWGELEALSPTLYVRASAEDGGDGSSQAPFSTISEALDAVAAAGADAEGGVIAVAEGTYPESLQLGPDHDGLVLAGRCAALVVLDAAGASEGLVGDGGRRDLSAALSGLTVRGAARAGVALTSGAFVLEHLVIEDNAGRGLYAIGAGTTLNLDDVVVARTVPDEDGASYGVAVWTGAELLATDLVVEDNQIYGVIASGSSIEVSGLLVSGTKEGDRVGAGFAMGGAATAVLSDARWTDNASFAISVTDDAQLELSEAEIEGQGADALDEANAGLVVSEASARLSRVEISRMRNTGLYATSGASLWVEQVAVSDIQAGDAGSTAAVAVIADSELAGSLLSVERSEVAGINVEDSAVSLQGLRISEVSLAEGGVGAFGVALVRSDAELVDVDISGVEGAGLLLEGGSSAVLSSVGIHDLPASTASGAEGIEVQVDGVLVASGLSIADVEGIGLALWDGASATLDGVSIERIDAYDDGFPGVGLVGCATQASDGVESLCALDARDLRISEATGAGLVLVSTHATLVGAEVSGTRPYEDGSFGYGFTIDHDVDLVAEDLEIGDVYGFGLGVFKGAATLSELWIHDVYTPPESQAGLGLSAQQGGQIVASNVLVEDTEGPGLSAVSWAADLVCSGCAVRRAAFAGALVASEASLTLDGGTTIEDTAQSPGLGGGVGIMAYDLAEYDGSPTLFLDEVSVAGSPLAGLYIAGAAHVEVQNSAIEGGQALDGAEIHPWGDAVFATAEPGEEQEILLVGNTLYDSAGAGLFLDGTTATLEGNRWEDNTLDVLQQGCGETEAPTGEDPSARWALCPTYDERVERFEYYVYLTPMVIEGG